MPKDAPASWKLAVTESDSFPECMYQNPDVKQRIAGEPTAVIALDGRLPSIAGELIQRQLDDERRAKKG